MGKKSKFSKYFWRLLILAIIIFFLWQRYPEFFKGNMNPILSSVKLKKLGRSNINWERLDQGIEVCDLSWKNKQTGFSTNLFMLRIDPDFFQIRILYQKKLSTAKGIAEATGAIAAINANFFDPNGRPLGLIMQDRKIVQQLPQHSMTNSGIFCLKYGRPQILHRSVFTIDGVAEAMQSFPRLLHNSQPIKELKSNNEITRRSGVAIDYHGNVIFYATDTQLSGISFSELQNFLMTPALNIKAALNLDGGRSSQFYVKHHNFSKEIVGLSDVPVFLGIFQK